MRLTASVAMAHSAVIGMKIPTRSPFLIPSRRRALARRLVSASISRYVRWRTVPSSRSAIPATLSPSRAMWRAVQRRVVGDAVLPHEDDEAALLDVLAGGLPDDLRRAHSHREPPGAGWAQTFSSIVADVILRSKNRRGCRPPYPSPPECSVTF